MASPFEENIRVKLKTVKIARLEGHGIWEDEGIWSDGEVKVWAAESLAERDWWGYVWCYKRPWRLDAFLTIGSLMSDREYWSLLGHVWLDCEDPHQRLRDWLRLWQSSRPHQKLVMDEEEREAFAALPDRLTIYRGVHIKRGTLRGLSWTVDRARAEWFANRRAKRRPYVVQAEISKSNVLAHFLARGEAEIIVLPNRLISHTAEDIPLNKALEVEKVYWQPAKRFLFTEPARQKEAA